MCSALIPRIENLSPVLAPITTADGPILRTDVRNNERVMFDDPQLAARVFETAASTLPQKHLGYHIECANERFRCYRYKPGMRFAPHADGAYVRNENEMSFYTYLIYLNEEFVGGETTFCSDPNVVIRPRTGCGLMFLHPLVHEGSLVTNGVKYVARTDVIYRKP